MVPVRKKDGDIRMCVDFRNLNRASLKDNYPLSKMDYALQKVTRAHRLSMVDEFSGYNQVAVEKEDQKKTALTIGLMNAGETFQRDMDIAFIGDRL